MSGRERSSRTSLSDQSWDERDRLILLITCALGILAVVVILAVGKGILAWWARRTAAGEMDVGAVMTAQKWLAWSARLDPGDGRTELMRATCFRRLEQADRWFSAMESAKQKGAPADQYEQEFRLGFIQSGTPFDGGEQRLAAAMRGVGASPQEVRAAFVHRYLRLQQPEQAKVLLDEWSANSPQEAHVAYMVGVYCRTLGDFARAEREFESAVAREPRHELARAALAHLLERVNRLDEALDLYVELATVSGGTDAATVSVARVLRKLGYVDKARAELEWLASRSEGLSGLAVEMGQLELECGNYQTSQWWFQQAGIDGTKGRGAPSTHQDVLIGAAITFALDGKPIGAAELLDRSDQGGWRSGRTYDLRVRLAVDPGDRDAASELERLDRPPASAEAGMDESGTSQRPQGRPQNAVARDLYAAHCAACHDAAGGGNGRAARHLFPPPRNLRTEKSRLVSTRNFVPTLEDLERVLRRGMPGTSMTPFEDLTADEQKLLAQEVLRLNRDGLREQLIDALTKEGEEIDPDEVSGIVDFCTTPGEVAAVPRIGSADSQAILRGKDSYFRLGCDNCHGEDGSGAGEMLLFDEKGRPSPPRDLAYEPFKGGNDPESLYQRIFLGMPGSPHPACPNSPEEEIVDLVQYCRSLSQEPKRTLTNHERMIQALSVPARRGGAVRDGNKGVAAPSQ
jgi:tetratricopeptide (TPR) repeat protein/mono/diheme cytochrome c family protein